MNDHYSSWWHKWDRKPHAVSQREIRDSMRYGKFHVKKGGWIGG